jgi:hypothetical protein
LPNLHLVASLSFRLALVNIWQIDAKIGHNAGGTG